MIKVTRHLPKFKVGRGEKMVVVGSAGGQTDFGSFFGYVDGVLSLFHAQPL